MMVWKVSNWEEVTKEVFPTIQKTGGLFLVTQGKAGKPNVMSIGWITMGIVWGRPIAVVLVRPSRYSYQLLEEHPVFTVNLPDFSMQREVEICGTYSGRDIDKFDRCGFTPHYLDASSVPVIEECRASLVCSVLQKTKVEPATFQKSIVVEFYPRDDFHSIYFGFIERAWQKEKD
ncbi:MAG: flavin reductase family protein [Candidatus Caldatribacteriaceae bacterium]